AGLELLSSNDPPSFTSQSAGIISASHCTRPTTPLSNIAQETHPWMEQSKVLIREGGVQLLLTIVDTPGFGDAVDNSNCWQPYNRRQMPDNRVQCCLYFIAPSGHGLKPLNIEFMKCLHERIMKEIQEHNIKIYEFLETDNKEENKFVKKIKDHLPVAVVGSNTITEVNGKTIRGRLYPWGIAEVENGEHCDFTILRNMLIRTHMRDLKDVTNNVHYENYRSKKLAAVTYNGIDNDKKKGQLTESPPAQMEEERREHVAKMKKMELEMEQMLEMKVKEKNSEAELQRHHEQMKNNLEAQHKELEEKPNREAQQRILEQQNSSRTLEKNKMKGRSFKLSIDHQLHISCQYASLDISVCWIRLTNLRVLSRMMDLTA
uniref:Septin-type G domain-containing protein n=1 Tax=Rhinopithecus roxellana TaxID=61622 RepID=A0A2K6QNG5_RHIRO